MKKNFKLIAVVIIFILGLSLWANAQDYHTGVVSKSYFGVGFFNDEDPTIYFTVGGGDLQKGDTIKFAAGRGGATFVYAVDEDIDISTHKIRCPLSMDDMKTIMNYGVSYVQVKDEVYFLKRKSVRKTKKMARKAFR
jgi:hypothetical protein